MALVDRLFPETEAQEVQKISVHAFGKSLFLFHRGKVTRANIVSAFQLSAQDDIGLGALIAVYQSLGTNDQQQYPHELEAVLTLVEGGQMTKAQGRTILGL